MADSNFLDAEPIEQPDGSAIIQLPEDAPSDTGFHDNLAETLDFSELMTLSSELLELVEKDKEARAKRDKQQEEGLRRTGLGDDAPGGATFDGASKVVHPVLAEGCVDFSARAMKEIFPAKGPVKTKLIGAKLDNKKLDKAKRKCDFLNWQLTTQIEEYRAEKEILLTQLPLGGSQYEKYWFDPNLNRIRMEFVPIDEVYLPYAATSFYTSPRVTHAQQLTRHTFEERVRTGFYVDIGNHLSTDTPEQTASQKANNKIEGRDDAGYNEDGVRVAYEIQCYREFKGDDQPKPYIVHIDESTEQVLAVYRNWREEDANFRKIDWWVESKFIPWRGAVGIGLLHLIGSLAASATGALRALLDSAHISNSQTAIKLKGGRASGQNISVDIASVQEIEAPAGTDDIRKVIMPMPFNPPSPVLYQLLEWLTNQARGVVATAEESIADASNTMPVGTALALIEQGSQVFSSIHSRLHASQARALSIICRLNFENPNVEEMERFGLVPEDFKDNDDVEPVSDPNIFSEAQRYAQLQETLKLKSAFPDLQWKNLQLARRALELLRVDYADEILPADPEFFTGDPISENQKALLGTPLKADPNQDHLAHLQEHLRCLLDPLLGGSPLFPGPLLQNIMANCAQHVVYLYSAVAMTAGHIRIMKEGNPQDREKVISDAAAGAMSMIQQEMPQLAQQLAQAFQLVQSKMPQPPQDPAVQATLQAAMAETQRRAQADAQGFQLKQQELQMSSQTDQLKLQLENQTAMTESQRKDAEFQLKQQAQQFKQMLDQQRIQNEQIFAQLRGQVEVLKNEQDNKQHQETELLKNLQDNQTQLEIHVRNQLEGIHGKLDSGPNFAPQMDVLNQALSRVEQARNAESMSAVMEGLKAVISQMNAPKMIIEKDGKAIGIAPMNTNGV